MALRVHGQEASSLRGALSKVEADAARVTRQRLHTRNFRSRTHVEGRVADAQAYLRLKDYERARMLLASVISEYQNHRLYGEAVFLTGEALYQLRDHVGAQRHLEEVLANANDTRFREFAPKALARLLDIAVRTRRFKAAKEYSNQLSSIGTGDKQGLLQYFRGKLHYAEALEEAKTRQAAQEEATPRYEQQGAANPPQEAVSSLPEAEADEDTEADEETERGGVAATKSAEAQDKQSEADKTPPAPDIDMPDVSFLDREKLSRAKAAFGAVPPGSVYHMLALYFRGVIDVLLRNPDAAIAQFEAILKVRPRVPAHKKIHELSKLALGRLHYEANRLVRARRYYEEIPRTSPRYPRALYEVAWVYIYLGRESQAERSLEVLTVTSPDSPFVPDARVLRAELLLRMGRLKDAETTFEQAKQTFVPVVREVSEAIVAREDHGAYFRMLIEHDLSDVDATLLMPPKARQWTEVDELTERAAAVAAEILETRQLLRETQYLIHRLQAMLHVPNPALIYPDAAAQLRYTTAVQNQSFRVLRRVIRAAAAKVPGSLDAGLQSTRNERQRLGAYIDKLPVSKRDFDSRDAPVLRRHRQEAKRLSDMSVEVAGLEARLVAIERVTEASGAPPQFGADALKQELATHRRAIAFYRDQVKLLRAQLEASRKHVGVGDARYARDQELRRRYLAFVELERKKMEQVRPASVAPFTPLFDRVRAVQIRLERHEAKIKDVVAGRVEKLNTVVAEEKVNVAAYRQELTALEGTAEQTVGGAIARSFALVRERFRKLILRADVGFIDVAWARHEEHRLRADTLSRERAREIQLLEDEYRELIDEGTTPASSEGAE